ATGEGARGIRAGRCRGCAACALRGPGREFSRLVTATCVGQPGTGSGAERKQKRPRETHRRRDPVVTAIPDIMLSNGQNIPQFGFGVFLVKPEETVAAVSSALQVGYRHIDTAEMYGNENEVGEAIARSDLDRGDVFVTSKLANDAHEPDDARRAFGESLKALGVDYLDLFLIHWPLARGHVLEDPAVDSIARRVGKTPAQVVLRWHIERGDIIFPKSVTPARIKENFDIFDFELPGADVEAISLLNRNERTGPDPDKFDGR